MAKWNNPQPWDNDLPLHPVTGVRADYFYHLPDGTQAPRWSDPMAKKARDPRNVWYFPKEIAKLMGLERKTVTRWVKSGDLPATKYNGRYYVRGSDLEKFMEDHKVKR